LNKVFIWVDILVYSGVPFTVMGICSIFIVVRIHTSSRKYIRTMTNKQSAFNRNILYKRLKRDRQLLYMLLLTNLYFILSSTPYCISFLMFKGVKDENALGQLTVHVLAYTNNAFNFVFYGISSQKYRQELRNLWKRQPPKARNHSSFYKDEPHLITPTEI